MELTSWEKANSTKQYMELPITGEAAVIGISFDSLSDFVAAGVLYKHHGKYYFKQHTWICADSPDLPDVKFPYKDAVAAGEAEIVKESEIRPEMIAGWVAQQTAFFNIVMLALDDYRFAQLKKALERVGFFYENKNIKLVRPSDRIKAEKDIDAEFEDRNIVCESAIMRWYINNTCKEETRWGCAYVQNKVAARKTDGFFALANAMTQRLLLDRQEKNPLEVFRNAVRVWGKNAQVDMMIEEMAELTKELLNDRRGRECNIAEEIADVRIMLKQMEILFQNSEEVEERFWEKVERLKRRLEKREEDELLKKQKAAEQLKKSVTHVFNANINALFSPTGERKNSEEGEGTCGR